MQHFCLICFVPNVPVSTRSYLWLSWVELYPRYMRLHSLPVRRSDSFRDGLPNFAKYKCVGNRKGKRRRKKNNRRKRNAEDRVIIFETADTSFIMNVNWRSKSVAFQNVLNRGVLTTFFDVQKSSFCSLAFGVKKLLIFRQFPCRARANTYPLIVSLDVNYVLCVRSDFR